MTKEGLMALAVQTGFRVMQAVMQEEAADKIHLKYSPGFREHWYCRGYSLATF